MYYYYYLLLLNLSINVTPHVLNETLRESRIH